MGDRRPEARGAQVIQLDDHRRRRAPRVEFAPTWSTLVEDFLSSSRYAKDTKRNYRITLEKVLRDLGLALTARAESEDLDPEKLRDALACMKCSDTTKKQRRSVIRGFIKSLGREDLLDILYGSDPAPPTDTLAVHRLPIPKEVVEKILGDQAIDLRERAFYSLIRDTAANPKAALSMQVQHLDLPRGFCQIVHRAMVRESPIGLATVELLAQYVSTRKDGPVFLSQRGTALRYRTAADKFSKVTERKYTLRQLQLCAVTPIRPDHDAR